jgi:hypothetical protein
MTETLMALAVQPWRAWSLAGFLWLAVPMLLWAELS